MKNTKSKRIWAVILCAAMFASLLPVSAFAEEAPAAQRLVLDCPFAAEGAERVAHVHNEDCFDENGELVCPLPVILPHEHTDDCYEYVTERVCGMEDTDGHQHGEACFDAEGNPICGQEETEAHHHSEACEEYILICEEEEREPSFNEDGEMTDPGHTHGPECWLRELVCLQEELPVHVHDANCFVTEELPDEDAAAADAEDGEEAGKEDEKPAEGEEAGKEDEKPAEGEETGKEDEKPAEGEEAGREDEKPAEGEEAGKEDEKPVEGEEAGREDEKPAEGEEAGKEDEKPAEGEEAGKEDEEPAEGEEAGKEDEKPAEGEEAGKEDEKPAEGEEAGKEDEKPAEGEETGTVNEEPADGKEADQEEKEPADGKEADQEEKEPAEGEEAGREDEKPAEGEEAGKENEAADGKTEEAEKKDEADKKDAEENQEDKTAADQTGAEPKFPGVRFEETVGGLKVTVVAEEGAFPEGTTMTVTPVAADDILDPVSQALEGQVVVKVHAVDITFLNADGREIEPLIPITVRMTPSSRLVREASAASDRQVVHVVSEAEAEVVEQTNGETKTEAMSGSSTMEFEAGGFSVYAIVYTVDFHYDANGQTYDFSIPGGGFTTLSHVVEVLGIAGTRHGLTSDNMAVSEETAAFIADVQSVTFSNSSLIWVGRAESDTTVGALKEAYDLDVQYSGELTAEEKEEIDGSSIAAGDWALISLLPFDSVETLRVTMGNGDAFTVNVTDAPGNQVKKRIIIHNTDFSGAAISAEEFGDGYDLHYYELPVSALGEMTVDTDTEPSSVYYQLLYGGNSGTNYSTKSILIDKRDMNLDLTMEEDASQENPYLLLFIGDDAVPAMGPFMAGKEWNAMALFTYDGTDLSVCAESAAEENGVFTVTVTHDDSLFYPKVTVNFECIAPEGESPYPVNLICTNYWSVVGSDSVEPIPVTGDGEMVITLDQKISRNVLAQLADANYPIPAGMLAAAVVVNDNPDSSWEISTNSDYYFSDYMTYIIAVDENDNILGITMPESGGVPVPGDKLIINFTKITSPGLVRLNAHTTDYNGNPITQSELGDGYDLYYCDVPLSVLNEMWRPGYGDTFSKLMNGTARTLYRNEVLSGNPESYTGANNDSSRYWQYLKSVHITSPDQKIVLSMNENASQDNPYVVLFVGDTNRSEENAEWYGEQEFFYDGTQFYTFVYGQESSPTPTDSNVVIRHDDTMVTPKLTVRFDASAFTAAGGESPYPVSAFVSNSNYYGSVDILGEAAATADGEYTVSLSRKISRRVLDEYRNSDNGYYFSSYLMTLTDPRGEHVQNDWGVITNYEMTGSASALTVPVCDLAEDGSIIAGYFDSATGLYVAYDQPAVVTYTRYLDHEALRIDTLELRDSSPVTEEVLGDGYDLVYYEIPASVWGTQFDKEYLLAEPYYPYTALMYPTSNPIDYSAYKRTTHIAANSVSMAIPANEAATSAAPYVYVFLGEDRELGSMGTYMEWDCYASYLYDGTQAYPLQGVTEAGSKLVAAVMHDDSLIKPKLKVKLDASDYTSKAAEEDGPAYPVTVIVQAPYPYGLGTDAVTKEVSEDGTVEFEWDTFYSRLRGFFRNANAVPFTVTINDGTASSGFTWNLKNTELSGPSSYIAPDYAEVYCSGIDEDGYLLATVWDYDSGTGRPIPSVGGVCVPEFEKKLEGVIPKVKVQLSADPNAFDESEFPLYLQVRVVDCYDSTWQTTTVVPFTSEDLNKDLTVTLNRADPYLNSDTANIYNYLDIYLTVYKDEGCSDADEGWGYSADGTASWSGIPDYNNDGVWTVWREWYDSSGRWQYDYEGPLTIYYRYVLPSIPYASFTNNPGEMYPAYLKVSGFDQERVIELTENGDGTIVFDKMEAYNINGAEITWSVYADAECTTIHPVWNIENQSLQVEWNNMMLVDYWDSRTPACIDLSKITTDTITVPVETSIGELNSNLFFPAYMTAILHSEDGLFTDVIVRKTLNSLDDANTELLFAAAENESFSSDGAYQVSVVITTQELPEDNSIPVWTIIHPAWYSDTNYLTATLQADGKLHQGLSVLKLVYQPLSVDVQPDYYLVVPGANKHIYVKTWLDTANRPFDFREITDKSRYTAEFPILGYTGADLSAISVMTENSDAAALEWAPTFEIPTSEETYFYSSESNGTVAADGSLSVSGEKTVLKPFESNKAYQNLNVPVKVHIPESGGYRFYNGRTVPDTGNPNEYAFYSLYRINPDTGNIEDLSDKSSASSYYSNYSYTAIRLSRLDENYEGTITAPLDHAILPGTYYINYGLSYIWNTSGYTFANSNIERHWTNETEVKVILTQDGRLTWENGDPVELHYYYSSVIPQLDVFAEYPDGSAQYGGNTYDKTLARTSEDTYTPSFFHYSMVPVTNGYSWDQTIDLRTGSVYQGEQVQNIPEGPSIIGSPYQRYLYLTDLFYTYDAPESKPDDYSYDGGAVIAYKAYQTWYHSGTPYIYFGELYTYGYQDSDVQGYPVGDYYLSYYTGSSDTVRNNWYQVSNLKVHYAEDGKLYLINEDGSYSSEPYVMQIRYTGDAGTPENTYESLKIQVNTTVKDGVTADRAFTEGDTFVAMVTEFRNHSSSQRKDYLAVGTEQITEAGMIELVLRNPDGSNIVLHDDACYNLSYGTFHNWTGNFNSGSVNKAWPFYNNTGSSYTSNSYDNNHPDTGYPVYFTTANVDEDGSVKGFSYNSSATLWYDYVQRSDDSSGEVLTFLNSSLILPWEGTDPGAITQAAEGENTLLYKPISDITSIKDKGNYIIVVQNQYDKQWYALYVNENGGNSVKLTDVSSVEDLEDGYRVDVSDEFQKMVFTASELEPGSDSVSLKLKSGYKENGKSISVKMGNSSDDPQPLLSSSAGKIIVRSAGDKQFTVTKGNYSWLWYIDNLYGWSGFTTISNKFGPKYAGTYGSNEYLLYGLLNSRTRTPETYNKNVTSDSSPYGYNYYCYGVYAGISDQYNEYNKYMADVNSTYLNATYLNKLIGINSSYPGAGYSQFYILSDDVEEVEPEEPTNKYTLVKTFGDFVQTFAGASGSQSSNMLLVYTADDGKEYAMEPGKLYQVASKAGGSGYRTVTTVADHVLIPNNNSGTSDNFSIVPTEVKEDGTYVFATDYAFRKNRQNNTEDRNYMTLSGAGGDSAWTKNDDAAHGENLVYVLHPSDNVYSQADWDKTESYTLSVIRNGETKWLGIAEADDGNGGTSLQMTVVDSEAEAVSFKVYSDKVQRHYASAYGTELYKYYKINSLNDINPGDEILIVYDDNGTKKIMGVPFQDNGVHVVNENYYYSPYGISPAVEVLSGLSTLDTRDPDVVTVDSKYQYRLGTSEYVKKPFAYADSEDDTVIWAQGVAANAIGTKKGNYTSTQRKFDYVSPLGNMRQYVYIKAGAKDAYGKDRAETNFFSVLDADTNEVIEGKFYIRGGKSTTWLGITHYQRNLLSLDSGSYEYTGNYLSFTTVGQEDRITVEVYRRPTTDETFRIDYYSEENVLDHSETKPKETFTLTQKSDVEKDGIQYVFVGYTTDYDKSGYLSLDDSANLYDYDDLAKLASIKSAVKTQHKLLGDCNPEAENLIDYDEVKGLIETVTSGETTTDVLKVYPVYAVRGYSAAVTANDPNRMIVGASDFKDLQNGATGATDPKERWLGSINIEVYKDGELWVPGADGSSTTGRKRGPAETPKATLYFAYHNDDAADLNIKFIKDNITAETLYAYLSSSDFSAAEPSEHYVIDGVYAEQGGSEDGLKYRFNWMDDVVGGQLDNVKGGSTVKIYVTTKYQVKYYLDKGDGNGYQELVSPLTTKETWTNPNFYTTTGTEKAIKDIQDSALYVLTTDPDTCADMNLIERTPNLGETFRDENMVERGEYSVFLYKFNEYEHTIPIAVLPGSDEIPAGSALESPGDAGKWVIRGADMAALTNYDANSSLTVTETTYGTGNSVWSYKGDLDDANTYHLYAKVPTESIDLDILKIAKDHEETRLKDAEFTLKQLDETKTGINYAGISQEKKTDANGKITFRGLVSGVYEIRETKAPAGYTLSNSSTFYIRVSGSDVGFVARDPDKAPREWSAAQQPALVSYTAAKAAVLDDPATTNVNEAKPAENARLTVQNVPGRTLPRTGGIGTDIFTVIGAVLSCTAGAVLTIRSRKRKQTA